MANEWFYQKDGQEIGPVSPGDLRRLAAAGELKPTDPVRKADMDRWAKASALKGLFPAADAGAVPPPVSKTPASRPQSAPPTATTPIAKPRAPAVKAKPAAPAKAKAAAAAPVPITEDESTTPPVKKSTPRWMWFAVAAVVLLGTAGGVYFYMQHVANEDMSVGPSPLPQRTPGSAATSAPANSVVGELQSDKPSMRVAGFRRVLSHKEIPDEDRDDIHKAACDTLADKKQDQAWTLALKVLGRIGTPDDMKLVTPLTTGGGVETQSAALAAAMLISPDEGAKLFEPHAGESAYNSVLNDVSKGGPRCEPALLALLKCDKRVCRFQALGLLGSHGTATAIDPIKQAKETETDASLMPAYQAAIDAINARIAKN